MILPWKVRTYKGNTRLLISWNLDICYCSIW